MVALIAIAPFVAYPFFVMQALCFALFACAFNLLIGYVNLLSLGHAMFLGIASYVCAHAAKSWGLEPVSAILLGGRLGRARADRRRARDPLERHLFRHDHRRLLADGLLLLPRGAVHPRRGRHPGGAAGLSLGLFDLSNPWILYVFVAIVFLFGFLRSSASSTRRSAEVLKAIRENEPRAISLGYRATLYKLAAFVLSAAFAGLAGAPRRSCSADRLADRRRTSPMSGEVVLMTLRRRLGHVLRTGGGRADRRGDAELPRPVRRSG